MPSCFSKVGLYLYAISFYFGFVVPSKPCSGYSTPKGLAITNGPPFGQVDWPLYVVRRTASLSMTTSSTPKAWPKEVDELINAFACRTLGLVAVTSSQMVSRGDSCLPTQNTSGVEIIDQVTNVFPSKRDSTPVSDHGTSPPLVLTGLSGGV